MEIPDSIITSSHEGRRRYTLTLKSLQIETLSLRGTTKFTTRIPLSKLSDEYSAHPTGSYVTKPVMFVTIAPMFALVLVPIFLPSSRLEPIHLVAIYLFWFMCCVVFGSRRDVSFWIYTRGEKDVIEVVGLLREKERLQQFVRKIVDRVRESGPGEANPSSND